jgi:F5/8 type C domain
LKRSLGTKSGTKSIKKVNRILITDKKEVLAIVVGLALALSTFSSSPPPSPFNNYFLQPAEAVLSSSSSIQPKVPQAVLLYTGQKYAMSPYISSNYSERTINKIRFPLLPDIAKPELILQTGKIISFEFSKTPKGMEAFAIDYDGDINSIHALKKTGVNTFELTGVSSVRTLEVHVLFSDGQYVSYTKLVDIRDGSSSTATNTAGKDNNADYRYSSSLPCGGQAKLKVAAVTASGQDTINYRATNVLDDNVDTIWYSKTKGDWIQLDLGEERSICNIGISFHRGDQSINFFSIQTSTDGAHFSPNGSGQNTGTVSSGELYGYADLPTTARFVRITNLGNMPAQEFGLAEVAVLGK